MPLFAVAPTPPAHADPSVSGGETRIVDVPLRGARSTGAGVRRVDALLTMIGVTWSGERPDDMEVRSLDADGTWSGWAHLDDLLTEDGDGKAASTNRSTSLLWTGPATAVEIRALRRGADATADLTAHLVTTSPRSEEGGRPASSAPSTTPSTGRSGRTMTTDAATGASTAAASSTGTGATFVPGPGAPSFVSRAGWGANESLVSGSPAYFSEMQSVVVHHTEGTNAYSASDSPQILREILTYHTQTQRWSDIGYNALVDRFGQLFEGRRGGLTRNLTGAQAYGYNSRTFGISMLGSYMGTAPSASSLESVARVAAWRLLGTFHADVQGSSNFLVTVSNVVGTKGTTVTLPRIFGHRDVNFTDCPGDLLYAKLPSIRTRAQSLVGSADQSHLRAFRNAGGAGVLGTVTDIAHGEGAFIVTRLTRGIVLTEDGSTRAWPSPFAASWTSQWGAPTAAPRTLSGVTSQSFSRGEAVLDGGAVRFYPANPGQRFIDVPAGMQFASEIERIAALGISTGWPDRTYRPWLPVARDAMVAFLYRAMGSPAFTPPASSPFRDITPATQFYKEITWAASRGIAKGWPDGTFRPLASIERQAVAAFLLRAAGQSAPTTARQTFTDVPPSSQFFREIAWLASTGITTGWDDGTFRPDYPVRRDAMAAFLVRFLPVAGR